MSGSFDPYHKWLGIPPREQPANHYRLLGLELFEDDREVIKRSVDRQMSYVDSVRNDECAQAAETLLEQLGRARDCLLDAEKKALYDEGLRDGQKVEWKRQRPTTTQTASPDAPSHSDSKPNGSPGVAPRTKIEPVIKPSVEATSSPVQSRLSATRKQPHKRTNLLIVISGVSIMLATVVCIVMFKSGGGKSEAPADVDVVRVDEDMPARNTSQVAPSNADLRPSPASDGGTQPTDSKTVVVDRDSTTREQLPSSVKLKEADSSERPLHTPTDAPTTTRVEAADHAESFPYDGMLLWLDAADSERVDVDESGRLKRWYDGSEARNDAGQAEDSALPQLVRLSEERAVVRFDGNESLVIDDVNRFNLKGEYSIIVVARGDTGVLLDKGDGYNDGALSFWNGLTSVRTHRRTLKHSSEVADALQLHSLIADETSLRWYISGTLDREVDGKHTIDNDQPLLIGRRSKESDPRCFVGDIAELFIYSRPLLEGERHWVEEYLTDKWLSGNGPTSLAMTRGSEETGAVKPPVGDVAPATEGHPNMRDWLPAPRGAALREVWLDVPGTSAEDFVRHVTEQPIADETEEINRLESPEDVADNYGQRLRGYLHPPTTGAYVFSVRANAEGVFYLSTDEHLAKKRPIKPGTKVALQANSAYYFEVFHKESTGRDYLSVGWTLPDGTSESPIPGERLSVEYRIAPLHERQFVPLNIVSVKASAGSELMVQESDQIVATTMSKRPELYELVLEPNMKQLTAVRIEALPHDDLPGDGPGAGVAGRFAVTEVALSMTTDGDTADPRTVQVSEVFSEKNVDLRRLVDGKEATVWRGDGKGKPASATFLFSESLRVSGAKVLVTIHNREGLGCFRVSGTSAPDPRTLETLPSTSSSNMFVLHANLGGDTYTTPDGIEWQASRRFENDGFGHEGGRSVTNDDVQDPVQGSAVRGIQTFRATVPNGTYEVGLYFCEYWSTDSEARTFSIAAEQKLVARNMSLLQAAGGFARPFGYPIRNVVVNDGRLDIDFQPSRAGASAILNAIRIKQVK